MSELVRRWCVQDAHFSAERVARLRRPSRDEMEEDMNARKQRRTRSNPDRMLKVVSIILRPFAIKEHPLHHVWHLGCINLQHFEHRDRWQLAVTPVHRGDLYMSFDVHWQRKPEKIGSSY